MKRLISLMLLTLFVSSCGYEIVDTGRRGVLTRFGEVNLKVGALGEGLHFYNPITEDVTELPVREEKWESDMLCYTADTQNVKVSFALNYRPDPNHMPQFFKEQGKDWANTLVGPPVFSTVKKIIGKYNATPLVVNRGKAESLMLEEITKQLLTKHILVENFKMTNLDFDDEFEEAIKKKVIAKEAAIEEENRTVQIREKNKQKLNTEQTVAAAIRLKAAALAKNKDLIQLEWVKKWNGQMPQFMNGGSGGASMLITPATFKK